jgi:hypothetical protein
MGASMPDLRLLLSGFAVNRRWSLYALGTGLIAAGTKPAVARASETGKKRKKRCKRQSEPCRADVADFCRGFSLDPAVCEATFRPYCAFLRTCDAAGFFACNAEVSGIPVP